MEALSVDLDVPIVQSVEVLGFKVSVIGVHLGVSARLAVNINCILDGNPFMQYKEYVIDGEEYANWGSDDNYVVELVRNKLVTQLQTQVEEPAQQPVEEPAQEPVEEPVE